MPLRYWCEHARLPAGIEDAVAVRCSDDGTIDSVGTGAQPTGSTVLSGLVLPSHVGNVRAALAAGIEAVDES